MPIYTYRCNKGHLFEIEQSIKDEPLKHCNKCRSKVKRVITTTSFLLKGGGWYKDGYSSKNTKDKEK